MRRRKLPVLPMLVVLPLLGLFHGGVGAAEGRIPIAASATIEQPGHYVVVRDIESSSGDVIVINSGDVTLDLGGHTITRTGSAGRPVLLGADASNVTVRNGRLEGGESGVNRFNTGFRVTVRLEDLEIDGAAQFGIQLLELEYVEILRCRITGNMAAAGIILSGDTGAFGGRINENVVENTQGFGISVRGLGGGEIRDNQVLHPGGDGSSNGLELWSGLAWDAGGNRVSGNTIRGSGGGGIRVTANLPGNIIIGNTVTDSAADGVWLASDGNLTAGNVASGNGGHGFHFTAAYNQVRSNHAFENAGDGLHVASHRSLIEDNTSERNTGYGLYFASIGAHAYRDNMLRGNTAGAVGGSANTDAGGNIP